MRRLDAARSTESATTRLELDRRRLESSIRARTRRTSGDSAQHGGGDGGDGGGGGGAAGVGGAVASGQVGINEIREGLGDHGLIEIVALDDMLYTVTVIDRRVRARPVGPIAAAMREVELARFMLRRLAYGRPPPGVLAALEGRRSSTAGHAAGRCGR